VKYLKNFVRVMLIFLFGFIGARGIDFGLYLLNKPSDLMVVAGATIFIASMVVAWAGVINVIKSWRKNA